MRGLHISTIFQDNSTNFLNSVCRIVQTNVQGTCNQLRKVCTFVQVFLKKSKYLECISVEEISVEDISAEDILARETCSHLRKVCTFVHVFLKKSKYMECISAEDTSVEEISKGYFSGGYFN